MDGVYPVSTSDTHPLPSQTRSRDISQSTVSNWAIDRTDSQVIDDEITKRGKKNNRMRWKDQLADTHEWVIHRKIEDGVISEYEESLTARRTHLTESGMRESPTREVEHNHTWVRAAHR